MQKSVFKKVQDERKFSTSNRQMHTNLLALALFVWSNSFEAWNIWDNPPFSEHYGTTTSCSNLYHFPGKEDVTARDLEWRGKSKPASFWRCGVLRICPVSVRQGSTHLSWGKKHELTQCLLKRLQSRGPRHKLNIKHEAPKPELLVNLPSPTLQCRLPLFPYLGYFQTLCSVRSSSSLHYLSPVAAKSGLHVLSAQQENNFNNLRFIRSVYTSQYNNWFQLNLDAGPRLGSTVVLVREQPLPATVFLFFFFRAKNPGTLWGLE